MIVRKWKKSDVVTLTCHIACVKNHKPLVGFSDAVEKAWRSLKRKHKLKERDAHQLCKFTQWTVSSLYPPSGQFSVAGEQLNGSSGPTIFVCHHSRLFSFDQIKYWCSASEIGRVMLKFRELETAEIEGKKEDVYSANYVPKKFSKQSSEYGTPKPGTLTEMRAKKASKHIAKEMLYLCEMIQEYGYKSRRTGQIQVFLLEKKRLFQIAFGKLFDVYQFISDKVVGMLLRARKHKMVDFEGEMLFQRRDEDRIITLLLTSEEIQNGYKNL